MNGDHKISWSVFFGLPRNGPMSFNPHECIIVPFFRFWANGEGLGFRVLSLG